MTVVDPFDRHVMSAILTLALAEARAEGECLCRLTGLAPAELGAIAAELMPDAGWGAWIRATPEIDEEERALRGILVMFSTAGSPLQVTLAAMIARRCRRPHHLWQDLGLNDRGELSLLMRRHFAGLAARNHGDMKWKKFLYRMLCRSEESSLCLSPTCSDCDDFDHCFGAEDGESLLARLRNRVA